MRDHGGDNGRSGAGNVIDFLVVSHCNTESVALPGPVKGLKWHPASPAQFIPLHTL